MKNIFVTTCVLLCSLCTAYAQYVAIPDSNFGNWLNKNGYAECLKGNSQDGWQLDTTCKRLNNAVYLKIIKANIHDLEGIQYFKKLGKLECYQNPLIWLPNLPESVRHLDCSYDNLKSLPVLPSVLKYLICNDNNLPSFPPLPSSLIKFNCSSNPLTELPVLPEGLLYLACNNIQLLSLTILPTSLSALLCKQNHLIELPPLPKKLKNLECDSNSIFKLPMLPESLKVLKCSNNNITKLPLLPPKLKHLNCSNNRISSLPPLPELGVLNCSGNIQITCLPFHTNSSINVLQINGTNIHCLPSDLTIVKHKETFDSFPRCIYKNDCPEF